MAYITLKELKEILPDILDQWIDEDDEGWEWIFQEIEQKCYIGTKHKGKKWKKELKSMVDTHSTVLSAHRNDINELTKKIDALRRYATDNLSSRINELSHDVKAAKSMAQTAKQRTDVDYTQISECCKEKSEADVVQEVYNRMSGRGATFEELNAFSKVIQKYDALNKKEIPVTKKTCMTCKSYNKGPFEQPCSQCCVNGLNTSGTDKWEAKSE